MKKSFVFLAAVLIFAGFVLSACGSDGGSKKSKGSVEILNTDNLMYSLNNGVPEYNFDFGLSSDSARFDAEIRDANNNVVTVTDPQNIMWTLSEGSRNNIYFDNSSSLSSATGAQVTLKWANGSPDNYDAKLTLFYKGISKTVKIGTVI